MNAKTILFSAIIFAALIPSPAQAGGRDRGHDGYKGDRPYCREYTRTVRVGGFTQQAYGTACLQPDGSWKIAGEDIARRNFVYIDQPQGFYYRSGRHYIARSDLRFHNHDKWDTWHHHDDRRGRGHDRHDHHDRHGFNNPYTWN